MTQFELHPNLKSKIFIADLDLCTVLMEDEQRYPWLFLVPRIEGISRIMDLTAQDQLQLLKELDLAQNILWNEYKPVQINVAAIGNKTSQLHVHVIARFENDPAWPGTVWDHPVRTKYTQQQKEFAIELLRGLFNLECGDSSPLCPRLDLSRRMPYPK